MIRIDFRHFLCVITHDIIESTASGYGFALHLHERSIGLEHFHGRGDRTQGEIKIFDDGRRNPR